MSGEHVLLRAEGQNLAHFVFDSEDLSTVRGGGLMLLGIADALQGAIFQRGGVRELLAGRNTFRLISGGASIALFDVELKPGTGDRFRDAVEAAISRHATLKYATVAVDVLPLAKAKNFIEAREGVILANRRRQLRAPSVVVPTDEISLDKNRDEVPAASAKPVCFIDKVSRAVVAQPMKDGEAKPIGAATRVRRAEGTNAKRHQFYKDHTRLSDVPPFYAWDLQQVAGDAPRAVRQLDRKIAVLYIDGNKFSHKQDDAVRAAPPARQYAAQREFDATLRRLREGVLRDLVAIMMADRPAHWGPQDAEDPRPEMGLWFNWTRRHFDREDWEYGQPIGRSPRRGRVGWGAVSRFETLLWGGDELMWVMPAWKGWEVLTHFYRRDWQVPLTDGNDMTLTHAAGLVFCHHNAPIRRIKDLAKSLAQLCKDQNDREDKRRPRDRFAYQVLESFDLVSGDIERHRHEFLPHLDPAALLLDPAGLNKVTEAVRELKKQGLPTRQLHQLGDKAHLGKAVKLEVKGNEAEVKLAQDNLDFLDRYFGGGSAAGVQMLDLWDYIAPEAEPVPGREPLRLTLAAEAPAPVESTA